MIWISSVSRYLAGTNASVKLCICYTFADISLHRPRTLEWQPEIISQIAFRFNLDQLGMKPKKMDVEGSNQNRL